jgi:predicted RNase H-like HicB family nuclease
MTGLLNSWGSPLLGCGNYWVVRCSAKEDEMKCMVVLLRENNGGYVATVPMLPGCVSQGDSRGKALMNITKAIQLYLEDVKAASEAIPVEDGCEYVEVAVRD